MNQSRPSRWSGIASCLRHWWGVLNEIAAAVRGMLAGEATRAELVGAELIIAFVLAAILIATASCWIVGAINCGYEYDEVTRAHWVWLTEQGLRPYHDFFENHPPYQYLLLPIATAFEDVGAQLTAYRVISGLSIPFLLAGLAALASIPGRRLSSRSLWGVAIVCSHPYILRFLIEFRMDNWAYGIIAWSVYGWRRCVSAVSHNVFLGVCTSGAAFWLCPKLILLPPILVAVAQTRFLGDYRNILRHVAAYLVGVLAAFVLFLLFLWLWRLDPQRVFDLVVRYNWDANRFSSEVGVLHAIRDIRPLFALVLCAAAFIAILTLWNRSIFDPFYLALICFLAVHAILVRYPYKQFVAPWFLLGAVILSHAVHRAYDLGCRVAVIAVVAVICGTGWGSMTRCLQTWDSWRVHTAATIERDVLRELNRITQTTDRVVCAPPLHPITRYDVFYVSCNSYDARGRDTDFLLQRQHDLSAMVTAEWYRSELKSHAPAVVVLDGLYPMRQKEVLMQFIEEAHYRTEYVAGHRVAVRPDRAGQLESRHD